MSYILTHEEISPLFGAPQTPHTNSEQNNFKIHSDFISSLRQEIIFVKKKMENE